MRPEGGARAGAAIEAPVAGGVTVSVAIAAAAAVAPFGLSRDVQGRAG
jgi:hypothetical protein